MNKTITIQELRNGKWTDRAICPTMVRADSRIRELQASEPTKRFKIIATYSKS